MNVTKDTNKANKIITFLRGVDPELFYVLFGLEIPIDPFKIAKNLDIKVIKDVDIDKIFYSGEIAWKDGKPIIWINPTDSETRQKFTLAHELGHYFLHCNNEFQDNIQALRRDNFWDGKEYEANNFAAVLLMPKNEVLEIAKEVTEKHKKQRMNKNKIIEEMAERFDVSEQAMTYRLKNLGILS